MRAEVIALFEAANVAGAALEAAGAVDDELERTIVRAFGEMSGNARARNHDDTDSPVNVSGTAIR